MRASLSQNFAAPAHPAMSPAIVTMSMAISPCFPLVNMSQSCLMSSAHFSQRRSRMASELFSVVSSLILISPSARTFGSLELLAVRYFRYLGISMIPAGIFVKNRITSSIPSQNSFARRSVSSSQLSLLVGRNEASSISWSLASLIFLYFCKMIVPTFFSPFSPSIMLPRSTLLASHLSELDHPFFAADSA